MNVSRASTLNKRDELSSPISVGMGYYLEAHL